jgi:hypothetical protein
VWKLVSENWKSNPLSNDMLSLCFDTGAVWNTLLEIQSIDGCKVSGGDMENEVRSVYKNTQEQQRFRVVWTARA